MIHISAPAKINLGLEVIRRRDDGYHDINTLFAAIDICDEIRIQLRDDREIICTVDGDDTGAVFTTDDVSGKAFAVINVVDLDLFKLTHSREIQQLAVNGTRAFIVQHRVGNPGLMKLGFEHDGLHGKPFLN